MIPVLAAVLSLLSPGDSNESIIIAKFPDQASCSATLEHIIHDAVCHLIIETTAPEYSPRPKRNPSYDN